MDQPEVDHILQADLRFWASKNAVGAVKMGLFTELAKHRADLEGTTPALLPGLLRCASGLAEQAIRSSHFLILCRYF